MKQGTLSNLLSLPKLSVMAMALAFGGAMPAYAAESPEELKQRIENLESVVKRLEAQVEAATAGNADQRAEFSRVQVKVEGIEDQREAQGFKDLKISGMIDPTYIYNQARNSAGFNFLSNFDARTATDTFAYDNSFFGQALIQFDKELDGGTKLKLVLVPHKSVGSGYNLNSIVHEANASVPLIDSKTRLMAGQFSDWSGYEYYFGNQTKLITHNLLFDFAAPFFYTGAGMEFIRDQWDIKTLVANMNQVSAPDGQKSPVLTFRGDYAKGEYAGFGFAGQHGLATTFNNLATEATRFDMFEVDGYFIRGDFTWQGQVGGGQWKKGAFNGGDASWAGISNMLAYKFTPRFEGIARLDYLKNDKNGGGTIGTTFQCADTAATDPTALLACDSTVSTQRVAAGDYRSGFGPSAADITASTDLSTIKGANRSTLSLGINYSLMPNVMFKGELRIDQANLPVFYNTKDGSYKKDNQLLGTSLVVNF